MNNFTVSLFGHRDLLGVNIEQRLETALEDLINLGANNFIIGTHGQFDILSLKICKKLKTKYVDIKINIALTSLNKLNDEESKIYNNQIYKDVELFSYDIESIYFKNIITYTNKKIVENSDVILCYVNNNKINSGAKKSIDYAKKLNKKIINIYNEKDSPFHSLTKTEKAILFSKYLNKKI